VGGKDPKNQTKPRKKKGIIQNNPIKGIESRLLRVGQALGHFLGIIQKNPIKGIESLLGLTEYV